MTKYGFQLNYKPGKSTFTTLIAGPNTILTKQKLYHHDNSQIYLPNWDIHVPVQHTYDYLGTHFDPTCSLKVRVGH